MIAKPKHTQLAYLTAPDSTIGGKNVRTFHWSRAVYYSVVLLKKLKYIRNLVPRVFPWDPGNEVGTYARMTSTNGVINLDNLFCGYRPLV